MTKVTRVIKGVPVSLAVTAKGYQIKVADYEFLTLDADTATRLYREMDEDGPTPMGESIMREQGCDYLRYPFKRKIMQELLRDTLTDHHRTRSWAPSWCMVFETGNEWFVTVDQCPDRLGPFSNEYQALLFLQDLLGTKEKVG